jgi:hypothetical protein
MITSVTTSTISTTSTMSRIPRYHRLRYWLRRQWYPTFHGIGHSVGLANPLPSSADVGENRGNLPEPKGRRLVAALLVALIVESHGVIIAAGATTLVGPRRNNSTALAPDRAGPTTCSLMACAAYSCSFERASPAQWRWQSPSPAAAVSRAGVGAAQ